MIKHGSVKVGDKLQIVGEGAPGFAANGEIVEVIETTSYMTEVKNSKGDTAGFYYDCGAARLELYIAPIKVAENPQRHRLFHFE